MTVCRPRAKVQHLEISVTIHPHIVSPIFCQKEDVDRAGNIERPDVNPIGVNLGFNEAEVIFAGTLRNVNATCGCACPESRLLARFAITFLQTGAQLRIPLRLAHDELHAKKLCKGTVKGSFWRAPPILAAHRRRSSFQTARVEWTLFPSSAVRQSNRPFWSGEIAAKIIDFSQTAKPVRFPPSTYIAKPVIIHCQSERSYGPMKWWAWL